jgi:hypothetical protein
MALHCALAPRSVVDCDKVGKDGVPQGDALGTVDTTVGAVVAARGGRFTAPLVGAGAKRGATLSVVPEEMAASKGTAVLALRGMKLANRCARTHSARSTCCFGGACVCVCFCANATLSVPCLAA